MSLFGSFMPAIMNSAVNSLTGNFSTYGANGPFGNYSSNMQPWTSYGSQAQQGQVGANPAGQGAQQQQPQNMLFQNFMGNGSVPYLNHPAMPSPAGNAYGLYGMAPAYGAGGSGWQLGNLGNMGNGYMSPVYGSLSQQMMAQQPQQPGMAQ